MLKKNMSEFEASVHAGLSQTPKVLEPKWLYDERGSKLFEQITQLDEYYLTKVELALLQAHRHEIATLLGMGAVLFEPGAGESIKAQILLDALNSPAAFAPADISTDYLQDVASSLAKKYPLMQIIPVAMDFTHPIVLPAALKVLGNLTVYFPGSTIGNLSHDDAVSLMRRFHDTGAEKLLIGVDLIKDLDILLPAYDDARGVTADFIKNILVRIKNDLGAEVDIDEFDYLAEYNEAKQRIDMFVVSKTRQHITIGRHQYDFDRGERLQVSASHKFSPQSFQQLAAKAGWKPCRMWVDDRNLFSMHLMERDA